MKLVLRAWREIGDSEDRFRGSDVVLRDEPAYVHVEPSPFGNARAGLCLANGNLVRMFIDAHGAPRNEINSVRCDCTRLPAEGQTHEDRDRKSTRLNSSHLVISYAVFCLKKRSYYAEPSTCAPIRTTVEPCDIVAAVARVRSSSQPANSIPARLRPD